MPTRGFRCLRLTTCILLIARGFSLFIHWISLISRGFRFLRSGIRGCRGFRFLHFGFRYLALVFFCGFRGFRFLGRPQI